MTSVFAKYEEKNWPYRYRGMLHLRSIAGGVPYDLQVLEGHLGRKVAAADDLIRAEIAEFMIERNLTMDQAVKALAEEKGHVGFRQEPGRGLYIAGSNLKAAMKEGASIAAAADRLPNRGWGKTNKGVLSWMAEHVFVVEDRLYLGVEMPTGTNQSFIAKMGPKGPTTAIQKTDYVEDAKVEFTVETDADFTEEEWAAIWTSGERNGLGASRKMGYGQYEVVAWDPIAAPDRPKLAHVKKETA